MKFKKKNMNEEWSGIYKPSFLVKELGIDKEEAKEFSVFLYDNHADEGYKAMRDIADDYARLYDGKSALEYWYNEFKETSLNEDTVKQNGKWVNKGKEGTHGKFKTKKAADAQRKAMFANGYREGLKESFSEKSVVRQELLDDFDLELESFWIDDDMLIFTTSEGKKYVIHNPLDLDEAELAYAVYDAVESELDESLNEEKKKDILKAIRTTSIPEGDIFQIGDAQTGWTAQIQNHGVDELDVKHNSHKTKSGAWGRIWKNKKLVKQFDGPLNVVRDEMVKFLQSKGLTEGYSDIYATKIGRCKCPHCQNRTLELVDYDNDIVICNECGAELEAQEQYDGSIKFRYLEDESINEKLGDREDIQYEIHRYDNLAPRYDKQSIIDELMDAGYSYKEAKYIANHTTNLEESLKEDWVVTDYGDNVYVDDKEDISAYSYDEEDAMWLGRKHRIHNEPLMSEDEFITSFFDDDIEGLSPKVKHNLYSVYKNSYNRKREFKDGRIFPALNDVEESLNEDYLMKDEIEYKKQRANARNDSKWLQELDKLENYFKEHPDFYVCDQFGTIGTRDKRYQEIFNELRNRGLNPRITLFKSGWLTTDAITVDNIDNKIPQEVNDILKNYPELIIWDKVSHKTPKCYKIKFDMRDKNYNDMVYNESLNEESKLDIINSNKEDYAKLENKIKSMPDGIEKDISIEMGLKWIKGNNWLGGLSDSVANKAAEKISNKYNVDIYDVFDMFEDMFIKPEMKESMNEELWDSSRVKDIAEYGWNKGMSADDTIKLVINQMKKEGSELPKDLFKIHTLVNDYFDLFYDQENPDDWEDNYVWDESLNEASYGGAFDIEDDMFFTREEINEFAYDIADSLASDFGKKYNVAGVYMETPTDLYISIIDENGYESYNTFHIDMRKIRSPKDLNKYLEVVIDWFTKDFNKEYEWERRAYSESLNEDYNDHVTQAAFDLFHNGEYDLEKLANDIAVRLEEEDLKLLNIDAEALSPEMAYSYNVLGEVDPDNVSSVRFDFANDGDYEWAFVEECIAEAVKNQNLDWGDYVNFEDVSYGYKESLKESKEVLYVIKDKQGNQLSRPTPDDDELWDRVESMEARGKRGLKVVVYTDESLNEDRWEVVKDYKYQKGDELTLWWKTPSGETQYAIVEYAGRDRDKNYKFISTTYGWTYLVSKDKDKVKMPNKDVWYDRISHGNNDCFPESLNEEDEYDDEFYKGDDGNFYKELKSKSVYDSDGFTTDYTLYMKVVPDGSRADVEFVTVFGDNELYRPEDGYYDFECNDFKEALEWFNSYNGFEDDDFDESLQEGYEDNKKSVIIKNASGGFDVYVNELVWPELTDEEGKEQGEPTGWKDWFKDRQDAVKTYNFIDDICRKYDIRIWEYNPHTFAPTMDKYEIYGEPNNIKDALEELHSLLFFEEEVDESLKEARYSDAYGDNRKKQGWWYFTTHGVQPGSIPKDLNVIEIKDGKNSKGTQGTFVKLDGILNTSELKKFDMKEEVPNNESLEEDLVDPTEEDIESFEDLLKEFGFEVEGKGKTLFGNTHYQIIYPERTIDVSEIRPTATPLIDKLHIWEEEHEIPVTWNFGLNKDGYLTAGMDLNKKWIPESLDEKYYVKYYDFNSDEGKESIKYFDKIEDAKKFVDDNSDEKDIQIRASNINEELYIKEAYNDYDPEDGWTEEDIELHKSIDWKARNYEEYDAGDSVTMEVVLYGLDEPEYAKVEMHKFLRSNPIYPPYYRPVMEKPFGMDIAYVGPMYDGNDYNNYQVHDRYETQETYDMLSDSLRVEKKELSLREKLNKLDHEGLDNNNYLDLVNLYEAVNDRLNAQEKQELKKLVDTSNDPEVISSYLNAKLNKDKNKGINNENN